MKKVTLTVVFVIILLCSFNCQIIDEKRTLHERGEYLTSIILCPVCDGQTIDQSSSRLAKDFRVVVESKLENGETDEQIISYFVERYGENVISDPNFTSNVLAWVFPFIIVLVGLCILAITIFKLRKRTSIGSDDIPPADNTEPMNRKENRP